MNSQESESNSNKKLLLTERLARAFFIMTGLGVAMGAFGAHALKEIRSPAQLETWKTATLYLLVHSLAGGTLSLFSTRSELFIPRATLILFIVGCVVFAGSLYALVLTQIGLLGAITPLGGLMFIAGWLTLAAQTKFNKVN